MSKKQDKGINPDLEKAISELLKATMNDPEASLTDKTKIEMGANGLPTSFVPGRNILFLTTAAALGYRRGIVDLVGGMCETDFSGYPDCRNDAIQSMARTLSLGMDRPFVIHTPLMWIDKAATFALAQELGGDAFVDLLVEDTHGKGHVSQGLGELRRSLFIPID